MSDAMNERGDAVSKTTIRRMEMYRDRWSSFGDTTGIEAISDRLSAAELRRYEIFSDYPDAFLERISPDVSVVAWRENAALFEQGSYLNVAFVVVRGEVEIDLGALQGGDDTAPIFERERTSIFEVSSLEGVERTRMLPTVATGGLSASRIQALNRSAGDHTIAFLATMDLDLPSSGSTRLGPGEIFGEIGAMSGWPQSVTARTATRCQLIQIRVPALRLMKRRSAGLKERIDQRYRERALAGQLKRTPLFAGLSPASIKELEQSVELVSCGPNELVVAEGQAADAIFLVRSGFVKLAQRFGESDVTVSYLSKGMTIGEVELLIDGVDSWEVTATSVEYSELVKIPASLIRALLRSEPGLQEQLWKSALARIREAGHGKRDIDHAEFTQVALDRGLVQGNSMMVIDLEACTRCDDCVRACAATHGGRPRFVREGSKLDNLLVAKSCYHCQDPVCLVGCPTGAIHRGGLAELIDIDDEICIGCGTCANNCPYDAIVMHETGEIWPDDTVPAGLRGGDRLVASKCDLCHATGHEPACVSNCPQGCLHRVGSVDEIQTMRRRDR